MLPPPPAPGVGVAHPFGALPLVRPRAGRAGAVAVGTAGASVPRLHGSGVPSKPVLVELAELAGVAARRSLHCEEPVIAVLHALPRSARRALRAELTDHHAVPVGGGPVALDSRDVRDTPRVDMALPFFLEKEPPCPAGRTVPHPSPRRVAAEEEVGGAVGAVSPATVDARPVPDGGSQWLPARQPPGASPALVVVLDVEAAHVAREGLGVVGLVPTWEAGGSVLPPHETRGAFVEARRRARPMAAIQLPVPVGRGPVPGVCRLPGPPVLLGGGLLLGNPGDAGEAGLLPLLLADVSAGGAPPGRRGGRPDAPAVAPRARVLSPTVRSSRVVDRRTQGGPAHAAGAGAAARPASFVARPSSHAARGEAPA